LAFVHERYFHMNMKIWIPVAIVAIVLIAFAGLAPLPGQKDNVTPHTQPGVSPQVEAPKGPPPSPPSQAGAGGTQPPPGGTPTGTPGSVSDKTSGQTMTGQGPQRGADTTSTR
jgi:hypothetical protein